MATRKTNKLPLKATVQRQSECQGPTGNNVSISRAVIADNLPKNRRAAVATAAGRGKEMSAADLANLIAPVFTDLSANRAPGKKWTNEQRKAWNRAANAIQRARGLDPRKDPM